MHGKKSVSRLRESRLLTTFSRGARRHATYEPLFGRHLYLAYQPEGKGTHILLKRPTFFSPALLRAVRTESAIYV